MSTSLDLNLLAVARYARRDYPELLGLYVTEAPRRPARGRGSDRLILYLVMVGNAPLPPGKQDQVLADLAKLYYETPGSVTAAMRVVAEELNKVLLARNLHSASTGRQGMGLLTQVVVRVGQIYLAQSGLVHAFLISSEHAQHFYDPGMVDQSLGRDRITPISYFQAKLQPDDTLLLAAQPSPTWDATTLTGLHGQGPESLRRRLFGQSTIDLNAVLIQAKPGKGIIYPPRFTSTSPYAQPVVGVDQVSDKRAASSEQTRPIPEAIYIGQGGKLVEGDELPEGEFIPLSAVQGESAILEAEPHTVQDLPASDVISTSEMAAEGFSPARSLAPLWKILVALGTPFMKAFQTFSQWVKTLLARMLPGEPFATIPSTVMAFIAIAVPVIVVTTASVAYAQLGRAAQYEALYAKVEKMAVQAAEQTDFLERQAAWEAVLVSLQEVEAYRDTPETQALRAQARNALDELNLVKRVNYQPAIVGGLDDTVKATRVVISNDDIYLLDSNSGSVIRALPTGRGYELDRSFQCGPDVPGVSLSGPLIDIAPWPAGQEPRASVLAIDAFGNLLFCAPNQPPQIAELSAPQDITWDSLVAITLDLGDLYVLDPLSNAVWIYWKTNYSEEPRLFFDVEIPSMQDVFELAVNSDELYMLHEDGHLSLCYFSGLGVAPTRCSDPPYVDFRPGREDMPLVPPNPFNQILYSPPPDPSLYLLEPVRHAIYHFSLRNLAFQRQFLPEVALSSKPATAFTVDSVKRHVFLAIDNEIYYGVMP